MTETILRSVEKGSFVIKENKKKSEEIYIRIRLESGQVVKVNKNKEGSKKYLKDEEIVILDLRNIIDIRNSEDESLLHKKSDAHSNLWKSDMKNGEKNLSFRFTTHHGVQFNLKKVSFRALNTGHYLDWITSLKFLVEKYIEMSYESLVESWLWQNYYEIGENICEGKIKGPVEIDDEFIIPHSLNKQVSSSLSNLGDSKESSKISSNAMWSDEKIVSLNQKSPVDPINDRLTNSTKPYQKMLTKLKNNSPNNFRHFRRFSWSSNFGSTSDNSSQRRFASPDCHSSLKSFYVKISPKQLAVWIVQQHRTKVAMGIIKEYNSNYPPKPNFIDFNGFIKIYKELLYQPEIFIKSIDQRLKKIKQHPVNSLKINFKQINLSLNPLDEEWLNTITNCPTISDFQGLDLDSLFNNNNSIWDPRRAENVYQDMDQPLSAYYISTSHNSYLTGDQITSKSSCEAYTRCIQMGCRSVELDCWNGDREPIIYHGNTLTSKIKLADVLLTIKKCAWQKSNYPLILSLEDHCDIQQQIIMAQMIQEIFQEDLLKEPVKLESESLNQLPSPNQLKKKIILKHKKLPIDSLKKSSSSNGLNEYDDDYKKDNINGHLFSGRMYMKDFFLDTWTPYYFVLTKNRTLIYTEDNSVSESYQHVKESISQTQTLHQENQDEINFDLRNVDNSARFITIDHGEKLAINCNNCIPSELTNKNRVPNWFYGSLSRFDASNWLLNYWFLGDGTFLIRTSESYPGSYSLSFYRKDKIHHVKICRFFDQTNQRASLGFEHCDIQFSTMDDLVAHYQENDMIALDFNIKLKGPPPPRYQDKLWYYENPPYTIEAIEDILSKIPLLGSFLVSCKRSLPSSSVESIFPMSNEKLDKCTEFQFVLSYKSRVNAIVHQPINYDGFRYTILNQASISLVELIDYFSKNRFPDGMKLKYAVDSNLIKKCNMQSSFVSLRNPYNKDQTSQSYNSRNQEYQEEKDATICPSVTANDLFSLHQNHEEYSLINDGQMTYNSHIVKVTETVKKLKFKDNEIGDLTNIGPLGNMEMGKFSLDTDCYIKLASADDQKDKAFMFSFDLYVSDFKLQLACETEFQRSCWMETLNNCLDANLDNELHLMNRKNEIQHKIAKPLSDLIIYCNSVPFSWSDNPEDFAQLLDSSCRDMSSISENRFLKLFSSKFSSAPSNTDSNLKINNITGNNDISFSKLNDLNKYHKCHLTRVYPKATRLDSSNMSPIIPWLAGVQMAAINFQTPDRSLQLNQALFRDNGGSGFVLKDSTIFSSTQHLEINLTFLGARHLPRITKGMLEIEILSIYDELYDKRTFPLKGELTIMDIDIPDIRFYVKNPNLAFIRFAFGSGEKLGKKRRMNSCQATFLVKGIRPGIRSVNLRNGFDYFHDLAILLFHISLNIVEEGKEQ